ncbi:Molybdate-anion transporter, partial [Nowakowskiella sp. JEL0078]
MSLSSPILISFGSKSGLTNEFLVFSSFSIYECTCGIYYPSIALLRTRFISDSMRATVMNIFRVPLNLVVVMTLLTITNQNTSNNYAFVVAVIMLILGV